MTKSSAENFIKSIKESLNHNDFIKLTLSQYNGQEKDLKNILVRRVIIKKQNHLSFTYRYKTRDIVKNFLIPEAFIQIKEKIKNDFKSAILFTSEFDLSYPALKKTSPTLKPNDDLSHDIVKNRHINPLGKKYLYDLKITDEKGIILKSSNDKFRQIDKYVEILGGLIKTLDQQKISKIVDMGSGKGYLTFALCDYLQEKLKLNPNIVGVECRDDLVDLCNKIAKNSNFKNLSFVNGTINNFDAHGANILIALHACDTATDDAIAKGVDAGADLIIVAPCCHKQIRKEILDNKHPSSLDFMTRHGIFMERHAEMLTDSMRAIILEYCGYAVKVFEFISGEHTAKNIMIVATKKTINQSEKNKIFDHYQKIKKDFGVKNHALEKIMSEF